MIRASASRSPKPGSPAAAASSRRSAAVALVVGAIVLALVGALRVHRQKAVVRLGYELTGATAELRRIREENRQLRLEISVLTSPGRIEGLATRLGLSRPEPEQVRTISVAPRQLAGAPGGPAVARAERRRAAR